MIKKSINQENHKLKIEWLDSSIGWFDACLSK